MEIDMADKVLSKEESQQKAEQAKKLFEQLSQKDVSDDAIREISEVVKADPSLLTNAAFVDNIKMPDFASRYQPGINVGQMLYESAKSQKDLKVVLDNLAKIDMKVNGKTETVEGKPRTAANYFLDNALLENGELVGTQMVKNIHFMGTMLRDKDHPIYKDDSKNKEARSDVGAHLEQASLFYAGLYTTYGANHNARNFSGQKVDQLMDMCLKIKKGENIGNNAIQLKDNKVETVQKRTFMQSPVKPSEPAKESTAVEDKPKRNTTLAEDKLAVYRGNATAEQLQRVKDAKTEDEMRNVEDPNNKAGGKHSKGAGFRDEDIIKYMYEEWFLALMSWGFDKLDDCVDIALGWVGSKFQGQSKRLKEEAEKEKDAALKTIKERTAAFSHSADLKRAAISAGCKAKSKSYKSLVDELEKVDFRHISPEDEAVLKERFGDKLVDDCKADPSTITRFKSAVIPELNARLKMLETTSILAMNFARIEMLNDVMRSDKKWRDKVSGKYLSNEQLVGVNGLEGKTVDKQNEILDAVSAISEDARLSAEIEYTSLSDDGKKKWVKKHIIDFAEAQTNNPMTEKDALPALKEAQKAFVESYEKGELSEKEIYARYSSLKVNDYINQLAQTQKEAFLELDKNLRNDRYDVANHAPDKTVKDLINKADNLTRAKIQEGVLHAEIFGEELGQELKDNIKVRRDLYGKVSLEEEATRQNESSAIEAKYKLENSYDLAERKRETGARTAHLEAAKKKIDMQKAMNNASPLVMGNQFSKVR